MNYGRQWLEHFGKEEDYKIMTYACLDRLLEKLVEFSINMFLLFLIVRFASENKKATVKD